MNIFMIIEYCEGELYYVKGCLILG